jgi:tRNA (mo5U34)-methyltransferase
VARELLGSRVEYQVANVYDLTAADLGTFDIILFLGVIYHLRHPLLALDRLREVCSGTIYVESLVCDSSFFVDFGRTEALASLAPRLVDLPLAQFLPYGRFHRDWTNKWVPSVACLRALIEDALFAPRSSETWGDRALVCADVAEAETVRVRREQDSGVG